MSFASTALGMGNSLLGGIGSLIGGNKQAAAYQQAGQQANQKLGDVYNQIRGDESPYMNAGSSAVGALSKNLQDGTGFASPFNMSNFYNDPGYQFTLQQGQNAINNSAAAKGGLLSGAAAKGLASYSTGLANQTYGDAFNRYMQNRNQGFNELMGVAGLGQNATQNVSQAGLSTGKQQAENTFNSIAGAANARAAGLNGLIGGIGGGIQSLGQYYASQKKPVGGYSQPTSSSDYHLDMATADRLEDLDDPL